MAKLPQFDITFEYDNKKLGLMLGMSNGMKMWRTQYARSLAPQYFIGEANLASLPPEQELALSQIEWHGGFGQRDFTDPRKYLKSNGGDCSVRGIILPAPLVVDAAVAGGGALDGTPVGMVEFKAGFYIAAGEKIYKWNTTTNVLDVVWAGVSKTITDIDVHGDYIFVALGGTNKYYFTGLVHKEEDGTNAVSSDDATDQTTLNTLLNEIKADYNAHRVSTTFHDAADSTNVVDAADASDLDTSKTLANQIKAKFNSHRGQSGVHPNYDLRHEVTSADATNLATGITLANEEKADYNAHLLLFEEATPDESKADYFGKNQDLLWKVIKPNEAKSASNPSSDVNPWGTSNNIGDASRDITEVVAYGGEIHFGKEDGLWKIDSDGDITDLLPDFKFVPQSTNFVNMVPWRGFMYLPVGDNTLYEFDGVTPFSVGPSVYSPRDFMFAGRITALAADTEWLYILSKPTGANTKAILLKTRIETIEGDTDYRVHPLEEVDFSEVKCAFISTLQGDNRRLWFGGTKDSSPKVTYIVLPKFYSCPWEDSAYQVCQSGSIDTSFFSANFPNTIKALFSFNLFSENLSKGHRTIKIEYQFEGDDDWTVLGTYTESPTQTKLFRSGVYGKKMQFRPTLETDDVSQIPRITGMLVTARLESSALKVYDFTVRCADQVTLRDGKAKDKKTMAQILKEIDYLKKRGYPFRTYDFLTGEAIDVDFVSPTPELAVIQDEPTGKAEAGIHFTALKARTE